MNMIWFFGVGVNHLVVGRGSLRRRNWGAGAFRPVGSSGPSSSAARVLRGIHRPLQNWRAMRGERTSSSAGA